MGPARHDWSARTARPPAASDPPGSRARGRDPGGGTTEGWQRPLAGVPARLALPAEHRPFPLVEVRTRAGPPWSHERAAERGRWAPRRFMVTISDKVKFPNFLMLQLRGCFPSCRTVFQLGRRGAPRPELGRLLGLRPDCTLGAHQSLRSHHERTPLKPFHCRAERVEDPKTFAAPLPEPYGPWWAGGARLANWTRGFGEGKEEPELARPPRATLSHCTCPFQLRHPRAKMILRCCSAAPPYPCNRVPVSPAFPLPCPSATVQEAPALLSPTWLHATHPSCLSHPPFSASFLQALSLTFMPTLDKLGLPRLRTWPLHL